MSQQKNSMIPLFPIPIVSAPQPLFPTACKPPLLNFSHELEMYKTEYTRLIKENNLLLKHLAKVTAQKDALELKYNTLNVPLFLMQVQPSSQDEKKKRVRRTAGQIVREFGCWMENCGKSYGTQASLAQHIKLKHPLVYSTKQCEQLILELRKKSLCKGISSGQMLGQ